MEKLENCPVCGLAPSLWYGYERFTGECVVCDQLDDDP